MASIYVKSIKGNLFRVEILEDGAYLMTVLQGSFDVGNMVMEEGERFVWSSPETHKKLAARPAPWQYKQFKVIDEDQLELCGKCSKNFPMEGDYLCEECR